MRKSTCKCIEPSACQTKPFFLVLSAFASSVPVSCRSGALPEQRQRLQQSRAKTKCCYCVAKMPSECPGAVLELSWCHSHCLSPGRLPVLVVLACKWHLSGCFPALSLFLCLPSSSVPLSLSLSPSSTFR